MAALMILQQLVSGVLLTFFYVPLPVQAYQSVLHIQDTVFLGRLVRNLHHWTGHGLVIVLLLHLIRVFCSGAFYPPRHRNWLVGLGLALLIMLANFSGYLLPWDQVSYWAVTIAGSMLAYVPGVGHSLQTFISGGGEVGSATLQLYYSLHTSVVPLLLILLMAYHFWYVRKAGGVLLPARGKGRVEKEESVPLNALMVQELSFAAVVTCVLLLFSMVINAPLAEMANPQFTPQNVKAPWYFLGIQELLLHVPPLVAVCILPMGVALFLVMIPFVGERGGKPGTVVKVLFFAGLVTLVALTYTGIWFRGAGMVLEWPW